ncbi:MAG: M64 family metallopeptidase [Planctomycetales bacterium]|nr:M64 family metallopeptidase [Planctomycetales bacterium]
MLRSRAGAAMLAVVGWAAAGPAQERRSGPGPEGPRPRVGVYLKSGPPEKCVDVLFVGDGYTAAQVGLKYGKDFQRYAKRFLEDMPFALYRNRFNVSFLFLESRQEGCDLSPLENKVETALESHFDSPSGRLLVFKDSARLRSLVESSGPVDIVFVMVNTEKHGGAGTVLRDLEVRGRPCPAPTFAANDTASFLIAVHELGHSFARLADEYDDPAERARFPLPQDGSDLLSPNVTLPAHFDGASLETLRKTVKWRHFLDLPGAEKRTWLHEGGYYRPKGVFRPWGKCRMRERAVPFCPVCEEEMAKAVLDCCGVPWDDAAYHRLRPLSSWTR